MARKQPPPRTTEEDEMAESKRTRNVRDFADLSPYEQMSRTRAACVKAIIRHPKSQHRSLMDVIASDLAAATASNGEAQE